MKWMKFLIISLSVLVVTGVTNISQPHLIRAADEKVTEHTDVIEPTKVLMKEIEQRLGNMLNGILAGNLKYVANEAGSLVDQSYQINETFFPLDPRQNKWFKRAGIKSDDSEKITNLKEEFDVYKNGIIYNALRVRKTALSGDREATFKAFTGMIEQTCFDCHRTNRDGSGIPTQAGDHGPGK